MKAQCWMLAGLVFLYVGASDATLIARWEFENSLSNSVSSSYTAVQVGTAGLPVYVTNCVAGSRAIQFNNPGWSSAPTNKLAVQNATTLLRESSWSFSVWINPESSSGTVFSARSTESNYGLYCDLQDWVMRLTWDPVGSGTGNRKSFSASWSAYQGKWALLTVIFDTGTGLVQMYAYTPEDGLKLLAQGECANPMYLTTFNLGYNDGTTSGFGGYTGKMDDGRMYDHVLSTDDIFDIISSWTAEPLNNSLIAEWDFENTYENSAGSGYNAVAVGIAGTPAYVTDRMVGSYAVDFENPDWSSSATNKLAVQGGGNWSGSSSWTFSGWIKNEHSWGTIFSARTVDSNYGLYCDLRDGQLNLFWDSDGDGTANKDSMGISWLTYQEEWTLLTVVFDASAGKIRMYTYKLGDELKFAAEKSYAIPLTLTNFVLGYNYGSGQGGFRGKMDCVQIYNRALCYSEVAALTASQTDSYISTRVASLPAQKLVMDFDENSSGVTVSSGGVGGSKCLTMSPSGQGPFTQSASGLSEARSLTITGWVKRSSDVVFDDVNYPSPNLLVCAGLFNMRYNSWGALVLSLKKLNDVWENIVSGNELSQSLSPHNEWVFFAFTYNGYAAAGSNSAFYYGDERHEATVDLHVYMPQNTGYLPSTTAAGVIFGTGTSGELNGSLDCVKIYASSNDSSACLSGEDIELIRQRDLGASSRLGDAVRAKQEGFAEDQKESFLASQYWDDTLNLHQIDLAERVFADVPPVPSCPIPTVPGGSSLPIAFGVRYCGSNTSLTVNVSAPTISGMVPDSYQVWPVCVEANNAGGSQTSTSSIPPFLWEDDFVAEAEFYVNEALFKKTSMTFYKDQYGEIVLDYHIPANTTAGLYGGTLVISGDGYSASKAFFFRVSSVQKTSSYDLKNVHWLWGNPCDLTSQTAPATWSLEHWTLLTNSAQTLLNFGQTEINVNLVAQSSDVLNFIQTHIDSLGNYYYDYTHFDQWCTALLNLGFDTLCGSHLLYSHTGVVPDIYVVNDSTGQTNQIFSSGSSRTSYYSFLDNFLTNLYQHLVNKSWTNCYVQNVLDEPTDETVYTEISSKVRSKMPGIKIKDACSLTNYSDSIDIQVINTSLAKQSFQNFAAARQAQGDSVWLYHCASPYPPYPNRHLDDSLIGSRFYPWMAGQLDADGYLYWAANCYREMNPYYYSVAPPGHPPGDNWMYYPTSSGLVGSMRMLMFREGLIDYNLLKQLKASNPTAAADIIGEVIRNPADYSRNASDFHLARKRMLEELE